jgi:hypothetical protein
MYQEHLCNKAKHDRYPPDTPLRSLLERPDVERVRERDVLHILLKKSHASIPLESCSESVVSRCEHKSGRQLKS